MTKSFGFRYFFILLSIFLITSQAARAESQERMESNALSWNADYTVQNVVFFIPIIAAIKVAIIAAVKAIAIKVPIIAKAVTLAAKIGPMVTKVAKATNAVVRVANAVHTVVDKLKEHQIAKPAAVAALRRMRSGVSFAAAVDAEGADPSDVALLQSEEAEVKKGGVELDEKAREQARTEAQLIEAAGKCAGIDPYSENVTNPNPTDADCQEFGAAQSAENEPRIHRMSAVVFALSDDKHFENDELDHIGEDLGGVENEEKLAAEAEEHLAEAFGKAAHDKEALEASEEGEEVSAAAQESASEATKKSSPAFEADVQEILKYSTDALEHDKKAYDSFVKAHKDGLPSAPAEAVEDAALRI